jgi:DNA replication protein DnaC
MEADIWDRLLASARNPKSTRASRRELRLRETAHVQHLRHVDRSLGKIDKALVQALRALCSAQSDWPLFLFGPVGTGKTCAALCLLDRAGGSYYAVNGLTEKIIRCMDGRETWYKAGHGGTLWPEMLWKEISEAPLFVLDELGSRERVSDHHYETVKGVLDKRQGQPLICVSNLDLAAIAEVYDDRIASRLAGGTVFHLDGNDRRRIRGTLADKESA